MTTSNTMRTSTSCNSLGSWCWMDEEDEDRVRVTPSISTDTNRTRTHSAGESSIASFSSKTPSTNTTMLSTTPTTMQGTNNMTTKKASSYRSVDAAMLTDLLQDLPEGFNDDGCFFDARDSLGTPPISRESSVLSLRKLDVAATSAAAALQQAQQLHRRPGRRGLQHADSASSSSASVCGPVRRPSRASLIHRRHRDRQLQRAAAVRSKWLIPADHPYKIAWDLCTILVSCASAFLTHQSIRDRRISSNSIWGVFTECWFVCDILLNFVTEYKSSEGTVVREGSAVWARYLTSWFVVDVLSLMRWEELYLQPIWERQRRRNWFVKTFFRSRAVVRVTRLLRGRHFRTFGRVARQTKHAGVGARRLLSLIIKYVPKYLLFYRNMKGVLAVRLLRSVHWIRKVAKHLFVRGKPDSWKDDDDLTAETMGMDHDDLLSSFHGQWYFDGSAADVDGQHDDEEEEDVTYQFS